MTPNKRRTLLSPPFLVFPLFFYIFIFAFYCALCIMYCVLCLMYYVICKICYVLCTVYYVLYGMHYVLCIIYFPLFSPFLGVLLARWISFFFRRKDILFLLFSSMILFLLARLWRAGYVMFPAVRTVRSIKINIKAGQFLLPCFLFLFYSSEH